MERSWYQDIRATTFGLLALFFTNAGQASAQAIATQNGPFPVTIGGAPVKLDGLIAMPASPSGKLPIALLVPGRAQASQTNLAAAQYLPSARDLASRGWLAAIVLRRGYGRSEGPKPSAVPCQTASVIQRLAADADDLEAMLAFLGRRADADPSRAIAIGVSGAGAAVVALSARNPPALKAVVSISGGLRADANCPWARSLVDTYKALGAKSRVANLWMYAKNDTVFNPDLVEAMHAGFLDGGGDVTFMMFEPVGKEGHALFGDPTGRRLWLRQVDAFLRARTLPTWTRADVDNVMERLNYQNDTLHPRALGAVSVYFAAPGEKALAHSNASAFVGSRPALWSSVSQPTMDAARKAALDECRKNAADCAIVMENFTWVTGNQ